MRRSLPYLLSLLLVMLIFAWSGEPWYSGETESAGNGAAASPESFYVKCDTQCQSKWVKNEDTAFFDTSGAAAPCDSSWDFMEFDSAGALTGNVGVIGDGNDIWRLHGDYYWDPGIFWADSLADTIWANFTGILRLPCGSAWPASPESCQFFWKNGSGTADTIGIYDAAGSAWRKYCQCGSGGGSAITADLFQYFVPGRWFMAAQSGCSYSAGAITANRLYALPFICHDTIIADSMAVWVSSAGGAGDSVRLAIYNATSSYLPGSLRHNCGAIGVSTTGFKSIALTPDTLPAGLYFLACESDGTPGIRYPDSKTSYCGVVFGTNAAFSYSNQVYVSHTWGTALPNPFGSVTYASTYVPAPLLRVAP